jgi:hypothetical protein
MIVESVAGNRMRNGCQARRSKLSYFAPLDSAGVSRHNCERVRIPSLFPSATVTQHNPFLPWIPLKDDWVLLVMSTDASRVSSP